MNTMSRSLAALACIFAAACSTVEVVDPDRDRDPSKDEPTVHTTVCDGAEDLGDVWSRDFSMDQYSRVATLDARIDNAGNIYVLGYALDGEIDVGCGGEPVNGDELFVVSYGPRGAVRWVTSWTTEAGRYTKLAVTGSGSVLVTTLGYEVTRTVMLDASGGLVVDRTWPAELYPAATEQWLWLAGNYRGPAPAIGDGSLEDAPPGESRSLAMVMDQTGAPASFLSLPNAGSVAGLSDYFIEDGDVIFLSWDVSTAPLTPLLVRVGAEPWSRPLELETTEIEPALGGGIVASSLSSVSRLAEAAEPIWSRSYEDIHGRRSTSTAAIVMPDVDRIVMASHAVGDVEPLNTEDGVMPDEVDIVFATLSEATGETEGVRLVRVPGNQSITALRRAPDGGYVIVGATMASGAFEIGGVTVGASADYFTDTPFVARIATLP